VDQDVVLSCTGLLKPFILSKQSCSFAMIVAGHVVAEACIDWECQSGDCIIHRPRRCPGVSELFDFASAGDNRAAERSVTQLARYRSPHVLLVGGIGSKVSHSLLKPG
jgi:hypothetical protein